MKWIILHLGRSRLTILWGIKISHHINTWKAIGIVCVDYSPHNKVASFCIYHPLWHTDLKHTLHPFYTLHHHLYWPPMIKCGDCQYLTVRMKTANKKLKMLTAQHFFGNLHESPPRLQRFDSHWLSLLQPLPPDRRLDEVFLNSTRGGSISTVVAPKFILLTKLVLAFEIIVETRELSLDAVFKPFVITVDTWLANFSAVRPSSWVGSVTWTIQANVRSPARVCLNAERSLRVTTWLLTDKMSTTQTYSTGKLEQAISSIVSCIEIIRSFVSDSSKSSGVTRDLRSWVLIARVPSILATT